MEFAELNESWGSVEELVRDDVSEDLDNGELLVGLGGIDFEVHNLLGNSFSQTSELSLAGFNVVGGVS